MSRSRAWEFAEAGDDNAVVGVSCAQGYVASGRTYHRDLTLVVRRRVEVSCIAPRRLVGRESRHANAIVHVQLGRYLPRVLNKPLVHLAGPTCVGPRSDLGVAVGQSESKIGD